MQTLPSKSQDSSMQAGVNELTSDRSPPDDFGLDASDEIYPMEQINIDEVVDNLEPNSSSSKLSRGLMFCSKSTSCVFTAAGNQLQRFWLKFLLSNLKTKCLMISMCIPFVLVVSLGVAYFTNDGGGILAANSLFGSDERFNMILERVTTLGVSDEVTLANKETPQYRALKWIADEDKAQLDVDNYMLIQRYTLAVLYFSTGKVGDESTWSNSTNWLTEKGICVWYGVKCHTDKKGSAQMDDNVPVSVVDLEQNGLVNTIPSEIGSLPDISQLSLRSNLLTGSIPVNIAKLKHLEKLDLGNNLLTGSIPDHISNLRKLQHLYLNSNFLRGTIPKHIGKLNDLVWIGLYENELTGSIPHSIGDCSKAYVLYIDSNNITGKLPKSMGNLKEVGE